MASLKALHSDWLEDLEIGQGRSAKTVENYDHYLQRFYEQQGVADISDITLDAVREFRRHLQEKFAVSLAIRNYHLIALRQFLRYLVKRDFQVLSPDKIGLAKLGDRAIDILYPEEVDALLAAANPKNIPPDKGDARGFKTPPNLPLSGEANNRLIRLRDHAILETLFATGMRVSECIRVNRDDIRASAELTIRGKGNKVRVVFLSEAALAAIESYLKDRQDMDPALFVRHLAPRKTSPDGEATGLRLTARSVQRLIKKYAALAGITKDVTPHTLRHSFATDLLSNGADVRQVQQLLGHASITTTQVYTHLTDVHLHDVHQRFHRKRT